MARTAAEIQKEIDALKSKQPQFRSMIRNAQAGVDYNKEYFDIQRQIQGLSGELKTAQYPTGTIEGAAQTAMEETQRRAEEDRKLALAGVTGRETQALEAITGREAPALEAIRGRETQATGAITAGRERGISEYDATQELLAEAKKEVSPEREAMMFEQGRTGIEAGTQAGLRGIQERYARGGAPGSAAMRMMGDVRSAGAGQLSELQRKIQLDRFQKLQGLTSQARQVAGAKAGIYGQEGRSLADIYGQAGRGVADIYGQTGRSTADIYGQTGRSMADIYRNTIAKVPDYSQVPNLGGSGGGGTTTTIGGFRTAPKKKKAYRPTTATTWGSRWDMN